MHALPTIFAHKKPQHQQHFEVSGHPFGAIPSKFLALK
jgi:hypothetical protein